MQFWQFTTTEALMTDCSLRIYKYRMRILQNQKGLLNYKLSKKVQNSIFCTQNRDLILLFIIITQQLHLLISMNDPILEFKNWYLNKPLATRTYLTGAVILALLTTLSLVKPYSLFYTFQLGILNLQIWRLFTTVFFHGNLTFSFIFSMYFAYFAINNVETQLFDKKTYADFLWLLIYLHAGSLVIASFIQIYFTADTFIFALMYIWCKRRPFQTITLSLMFIPSGVNLKSGYFPWVYMGFNVLLGKSFLAYLVGLFLGHVYIFIKDIMLLKTHKDYLPTPKFFKNWVYFQKQNHANTGNLGQGVRME